MLTITKIKQIGKTNRYHVYVDEEWYGIFLDEVLAREHLKTNQEIEEDVLKKIKEENDERVSFDMAVSYMEKYVASEKGIRDYLKKKSFDDDIISKTIEKLRSYGFVDDEKIAKSYFESLSNSKGKRVIANKLRSKGISKEIVDSLIEKVDDEGQLETAKRLAEKFVKNRDYSLKTKQKCLAHLLYKGYDYSVAQRATHDTFSGKESDDFEEFT